jgi:hypothetical protein
MEITCFVMPDLISLPRQVVRRGHPETTIYRLMPLAAGAKDSRIQGFK